jgi:hypothetical protein
MSCNLVEPRLALADPCLILAEPIQVVIQQGGCNKSQLQPDKIPKDCEARLVENGYRYSRSLGVWWKGVDHDLS